MLCEMNLDECEVVVVKSICEVCYIDGASPNSAITTMTRPIGILSIFHPIHHA